MAAIKRVLNLLSNSLTLIVISMILLVAFFFNNDGMLLGFPIRMILMLVYGVIIYGVYKLCRQWRLKLFYPMIGLLIIVQLSLVLKTNYYLITDSGYVYIQAQNLAVNHFRWMDYFYIYPNNVNTAIFWSGIYRVFNWMGIHNPVVTAQVLQLLVFDCSILLLGYVLQRALKKSIGKIFIIISMSFLPYTFFTKFLYNDIFVVSFAMLFMAALIYSNYCLSGWYCWLVIILGSLPLAISCVIRQNMLVILIAILIGISFFLQDSWKIKLGQIGAIFLVVLCCQLVFAQLQQVNHFQAKPNLAHPTLSWVNMGLNPQTNGEISSDAWLYEDPNFNVSKKNKLYKRSIEDRLNNYRKHPKQFVKHIFKKIRFMYAIGFTYQDFPPWYTKGKVQKPILSMYGSLLAEIFQPLYLIMYLLAAITIFQRNRDNGGYGFIINIASLAILGVFLFQIGLWEVRDRYSFITMPFLVLLASFGFDFVGNRAYQSQVFNQKYRQTIVGSWLIVQLAILLYGYKANQKNAYALISQPNVLLSQKFIDYAGAHSGYLHPSQHLKIALNIEKNLSQMTMVNKGFIDRHVAGSGNLNVSLLQANRIIDSSSSDDILFTGLKAGQYILDIENIGSRSIYPVSVPNVGAANFKFNPLSNSVEGHPELLPSFEVSIPHNVQKWSNQRYHYFFVTIGVLVIIAAALIWFVF